MRHLALALVLAGSALSADMPFRQTGFAAGETGAPEGWTRWAPREEIAPRTYVDVVHSRNGKGSLAISGRSNAAVFGGWQHHVQGIEPGRWYRFQASYAAEGLDYEPRQIVSRLDWMKAGGKRAGLPDYAWLVTTEGQWRTVTLDAEAPEDASGVDIQILLLNAPRATVWWDSVSLQPIETPRPRPVVVSAVNLRPQHSSDPVGEFLSVLDTSLPANADIVLLPEGITVVGTDKQYADVSEPVPGPTTARLGRFASKHKVWMVAGLYEREGATVYNTAVLIDRDGQVTGRYRKVYIPREELEGGITPGSDYPVFHTDFGTVGMMICWDAEYVDPARALALRGAELILMPIWGGTDALVKARAIENRVFLASSGYDYPTLILDPTGRVLASAPDRGAIATATIDLNRRYRLEWLGDMRERFMKEARFDVPVDSPGRR